MPSVNAAPTAKLQFNQNGVPLAGGLLFTYEAGTTTKLATYTDAAGNTQNQNPITLDANGQCNCWLQAGQKYKLVLAPATDTDPPTNPYWTEDNITGINDLSLSGSGYGIDQVKDGVKRVTSIAALRALRVPQGSDATTVEVDYYLNAGDQGGGTFYFVAVSTATDDGGLVINPNNNVSSGRWLRKIPGKTINVRWFGAQGNWNGTTGNDDTGAINAALLACFPSAATVTVSGVDYYVAAKSLDFPPGAYRVTGSLYPNLGLSSTKKFTGLHISAPRSTPVYAGGNTALNPMSVTIVADPAATWTADQAVFNLQYGEYSTIDHLAVKGIYGTTRGIDVSNGAGWGMDSVACYQHKYGVYNNQSGQARYHNVGVSNCQNAGLYMLNSGDSDLDTIYANTNNQNYATDANQGIGIYLGQSNNVNIRGGKNEYNSIGIYVNDSQGINIGDVQFDSNGQVHILGNYDSAVGTTPNALQLKSIQIKGNRFLGGGFLAGTLAKAHIAIYSGQSDSNVVIEGNSFRKGSGLAYDENTGGAQPVGPGTYCIYADHQGDSTYNNNYTVSGNDFWNGSVTNTIGVNAPNGAKVNFTGKNTMNLPNYINGAGVTLFDGPSFHAYSDITTNSVTGDGTAYPVIFDSVDYNYGNYYNPATGIFTAPFDGTYLFSAGVGIKNHAGSGFTFAYMSVYTPTYSGGQITLSSMGGADGQLYGSALVQMKAGDTAQIKVLANGGTKTANVGSDISQMYFSGHLVS